jgi:phospholipid transport system substrate-binding protein
MRSRLLQSLVVLAGFVAGGPAIAANAVVAAAPVAAVAGAQPTLAVGPGSAPDTLLSAATSAVIARLKEDGKGEGRTPANVAELLESTILPLLDFRHMTRLAVARNWKQATPAQQDSLTAEFKTLLVRTYYAALANYRDEVIEYKPLLLTPESTDVTVKSTVKKPGVERMTIDYDMEKTAAGWKVYDIRISGISLTTTYRSSFAEIIRDGSIDTLISYLAAKNRQASLGPRSDDSEARGLILLYGVAPSLLRGPR